MQGSSREIRFEQVVLALLCLAGAGLRLSLLYEPVRIDEAYTYLEYVRLPFWSALSDYTLPNNHIFHSLCAWPVVRLLGPSAATLRLTVLLAGVALIPLAYALGSRIGGGATGLIAAALCAGAFPLVHYSVDARGYMLQTALFAAAMALLPNALEPGLRRLRAAAAVALLLALALFTVPTMIFALGVPWLWGLALGLSESANRSGAMRRSLTRLALVAALTAALAVVLYAPAIFTSVLPIGVHFPGPRAHRSLPADLHAFLIPLDRALPFPLYWIAGAAIAVSAAIDLRHRRVPLLLWWFLFPLIALLFYRQVSANRPFERNFLVLLPLLFALTAQGLTRLRPGRIRPVATATVSLLLFGWTASDAYGRCLDERPGPGRDPRALYRVMSEILAPGDHLALHTSLYHPLRFTMLTGLDLDLIRLPGSTWALSVARWPGDAGAEATARVDRLFVLVARGREERLALNWLRKRARTAALGGRRARRKLGSRVRRVIGTSTLVELSMAKHEGDDRKKRKKTRKAPGGSARSPGGSARAPSSAHARSPSGWATRLSAPAPDRASGRVTLAYTKMRMPMPSAILMSIISCAWVMPRATIFSVRMSSMAKRQTP